MEQTKTILNPLIEKVRAILEPLGFEVYPFKVGWYNEHIKEIYKLPDHEDTLCILVISIREMWEKAFVPFIKHQSWNKEKDPLNQCMVHYFNQVEQNFPEHDVESMHQFEMVNGHARILVQTAAHMSGAAYYYQERDVTEKPWPNDKKKYGVCYHPKHGGWMSLDGVLIFKDVLCPDLPNRDPPDVVDTQEKRVELLEQFNIPDWSFRDLLSTPERKYFQDHIEYLSTEDPQKRRDIVQGIRSQD